MYMLKKAKMVFCRYGRKATETRVIKGVTIPAGSCIMCPVCLLLNDEKYFPEPERFLPERYGSKQLIYTHDLISNVL